VPFPRHVRPDHDETLVARLAADDLAARELEVVRAQVAECPACAELLADLLSIAAATARLPGPQRTRDFRLTAADAARLRPAGWRGLLARLGSPGFAFVKPLAGGLAALGVAGLILASLPSAFMSSSAGSNPNAISDSGTGGAAPSQAAPAPAFGPDSPGGEIRASSPFTAPGASGGVGVATEGGPKSGSGAPEAAAAPSASDERTPVDLYAARDQATTAEPPSQLLVLSVILLAAGIVLGCLRLIGRWLA
jgi:anti-sigma factor RsiW